jgi:hypothetical protein
MGAEFLDTWRNVRVSGEALKRLGGIDMSPSISAKGGEWMDRTHPDGTLRGEEVEPAQ